MNKCNKAHEIRRLLQQSGVEHPSGDIISNLKHRGISVTPQQVSNEKRRMRRKLEGDDDIPLSIVKKVHALVQEVGSTAIVRRALDELELLINNK